jgi:hypothetical protein
MISLFFELHLSFLVDLLDVSFEICRFIFQIEALMSFLLSLFHVILEIKQSKESLSQSIYVHEIIVVMRIILDIADFVFSKHSS